MKMTQARVLLTGASGGIGAATARELLMRGASVLLHGRNEVLLRQLQGHLGHPDRLDICAADLTDAADRERLCLRARSWHGGINTLINNAGVSELKLFDHCAPDDFERMLAINLIAPMQLCRDLLPHLRPQPKACIVNVGSVMGALGLPGYSLYCASKFGLRGFSEALRRELADSNVHVQYIAPRGTQTPLNSTAVIAMNTALGSRMDAPARVAREIVHLLERGHARRVIGWPEKLFVRLNQLCPALIDRALRRQLPVIKHHATSDRALDIGTAESLSMRKRA